MYIEFVISYVLIGLLALLLAVVIVLQCIIIKKLSQKSSHSQEQSYSAYSKSNAYNNRGIAVCRNCATQFDSTQSQCPRCGTSRQ